MVGIHQYTDFRLIAAKDFFAAEQFIQCSKAAIRSRTLYSASAGSHDTITASNLALSINLVHPVGLRLGTVAAPSLNIIYRWSLRDVSSNTAHPATWCLSLVDASRRLWKIVVHPFLVWVYCPCYRRPSRVLEPCPPELHLLRHWQGSSTRNVLPK